MQKIKDLSRHISRHQTHEDAKHRDRKRTCISHVPHGVLKGPDDGVQHQLKLRWWNGQESRETLRVHRLQQVEEVCPVFWELLKVLDRTREEQQNNQHSLLIHT